MTKLRIALALVALALALATTVALATARPAGAFIHEKIGAGCRFGGADVEPPGQTGAQGNANSFIRALQATGIISSIVATPTAVTINFDFSKPSSKFTSAGFNLVIPNGAGPGVALILAPLGVPDPGFPAFVHCNNLNP